MGRICGQMFQFWRFTNQMMRYKVGLTVADRSLTRNWLAFVGDGNAHTGLQCPRPAGAPSRRGGWRGGRAMSLTPSIVAARRNTGHEVRLTLLVSLGRVTRVLRAEPHVSPIG